MSDKMNCNKKQGQCERKACDKTCQFRDTRAKYNKNETNRKQYQHNNYMVKGILHVVNNAVKLRI